MSLHGCLPREGQAYFILIFFMVVGGLVEATVSFIGVDNHNTHKVYRYLLNTFKYALHVTLTIVAEFLFH